MTQSSTSKPMVTDIFVEGAKKRVAYRNNLDCAQCCHGVCDHQGTPNYRSIGLDGGGICTGDGCIRVTR